MITQWVKVLVVKPGNLSSILGSRAVGENQFLQDVV